MNSLEIAELCVRLSTMNREELIKECMNKALDEMDESEPICSIPEDDDIFNYRPSKKEFVEYATMIMKSTSDEKTIFKHILIPVLEEYKECFKKTSRKRIVEEPEETEIKRRRVPTRSVINEEVLNEINLPEKNGITSSGSMTCVSKTYFKECQLVYPGIYVTPNSGFILFCVDNGRYSSSWRHSNGVTFLTWVTANKDKYRETLEAISKSTNIHIFRKLQGEPCFRYIGKVSESKNLNMETGKIDFSVC